MDPKLEFVMPQRLWLLLAVVALAASYIALQARRSRYAVRFTNLALLDRVAPKRPGWRRHLPALLLLIALTGMVGAFAQPARMTRVPRERATIIVAIDTSLSMQATDVDPSRLVAAQAAANEFVDKLPARLNVGLVTFNGIAKVAVPPTQNRDELHAAIDQLRLGERTAIGEAIYASLDAIGVDTSDPGAGGDGTGDDPADDPADDDPVPARIVLMSDGSTTVGRPDAQAAAAAKRAGVPVSTIAFGTPYGTIDLEGQEGPISVAVNPEALAAIANATDGTAFTAETGAELQQVYDDIGSSVGYTTEQRDITTTFVGVSLVFLFGAAVLSQLWFSRLP
ncbi:MAG TPA: VWA domain-containing protein [Acidimicrobiales bacterium]|jgi:Ca-activated chloride channel homolog|nr:VWA domain-containing protein [Acidimicrobiales bacterium]HMS89315.1 VWA domain-containing protein [Acidimicrobiales bacterium]HRA33753.1 VWA domain-containing protein [Acidimicrobiales bacterium]